MRYIEWMHLNGRQIEVTRKFSSRVHVRIVPTSMEKDSLMESPGSFVAIEFHMEFLGTCTRAELP